MTDEEKAEFINETTEKICDWLASEKSKIKQAIKEGLEKGLAEGRKEVELDKTITQIAVDKAVEKIETLKKENAELKAHCKAVDDINVKLRNCHNCNNWNWKHNKCEKKLKGDCFKQSKWELAE